MRVKKSILSSCLNLGMAKTETPTPSLYHGSRFVTSISGGGGGVGQKKPSRNGEGRQSRLSRHDQKIAIKAMSKA